MKRCVKCDWCLGSDMMQQYHDTEWGVPNHSDVKHFEFLVLEGAQAGLSWATILKRRQGYRKAFKNYDLKKISNMTEKDVENLMNNTEIIRNKLKIKSAISNAAHFIKIQKEFGSFDKYIWSFVYNTPITNKFKSMSELPAKTELSDKISTDLKKRGFNFVGSTIIYSYLQAMGLTNDHLISCFRYKRVNN